MDIINELYIFIVEESEGEGIPAVEMDGVLMPLVGADMETINEMRRHAQMLADNSGFKIRLVRFSVREEMEIIEPKVST